MRSLMRFRPLCCNTSYKLVHFRFPKLFQINPLSSFAKPSKSKKTKETIQLEKEKQKETGAIWSFFSDITENLRTNDFSAEATSSGILIPKENSVRDSAVVEGSSPCSPTVCKNAEDGRLQENEEISVLEDTQLGNLVGDDVSPVVHEVTKIVRAEDDSVSMEERLANMSVQLDSEIVDKVLKRCFKVPHLAMRFFNWVKLRDGLCHTTKTYNTMLHIAGEAKEIELMERLVEEMEKSSWEQDIKTWTILISHYGKAKLIGKSLLIYDKMRKSGSEPDALVYKMMISSLCDAGKAEIAMEFYREMVQKDIGLDLRLYKMLLSCIAMSGDTDSLHLVADDMMKISQISDHIVYGCVLRSFCISGRIREALEFTRDLKNKGVALAREYLETLLKGLCRAGRIEDALEILNILKKRDIVDGKVYAIIINGYLRRNDVSNAIDLFQKMKESGHSPTTSTYTELMQHLFRANQYQKGCELYNEMLERGPKPDSVAITAMVAGHIRQNRISEAWKVFKSMEDEGIRPTWKSYSIFIKELCRISEMDEIVKVLNDMQASKIVIGDKVFNWVVAHMEKKGEVYKVEKVKLMQRTYKLYPQEGKVSGDDGFKGQEINMDLVYQSEPVIKHCDQVEPLSEAYNEQDLHEVCRLLSSSLDWRMIQGALEECTIQFTPEFVLEVLRNSYMNGYAALQFFSWVSKRTGYCHTTETYNMAIKLAGRGKDFKHMRHLFYEMRRKGYLTTSDTWTIMIMLYGRTGLTEIALKIFDEMKAYNCKPTDSTYKYLIMSLCEKKGRKVDEAMDIFQQMLHAGHIPDRELVETYLGCLCEVGKLLDARKCTDSLHKVGFTVPLSYSLNIRALCRAGRIEEALAMADEVGAERTTLDQYTYGSLVHALLQKGRIEEALAKVDSMKQEGINPTVHVYTSLIVHFLKEKKIERALETLQQMQQEGCEPTVVTYSALIRGFMDIGKVADAWNVFYFMKLKGPSPDFKTYSLFITCLCRVGKSEEALRLIHEMPKSGIVPSSVNFRTVFYGLNREGKKDLAYTVMQQKSDLIRKRKFIA
ncbi:hypothetical protein FEM48_Zijuj12G0073000 [Ziziphus jujuba var. spinosa]|uniref:Pentatricopeptide repeat-containing protein At5g06400, mitochondrial n=1 Tax=Ziziphus jujuba var. spinosa TaxID=714518 RepID=A0A978UBY0_ZIZJJ|nr:hypothetical protein FEM48_Zijuj12G0073000 [Ziziphus jujuba var. spinosa]